MKRVATLTENGNVIGLVHGPDFTNQQIEVEGKTWRFDFDEWGGPLWLKADGFTLRKCQCPTNQKVWDQFDVWFKQRNS